MINNIVTNASETLARSGPLDPISIRAFHSFGGTSLPEGALDREQGIQGQSEATADLRGVALPWRDAGVLGLSSPRTQDPQESQSGASPSDFGKNELARRLQKTTAKYKCWMSNLKARGNTAYTTKGTLSTTQKPGHRRPPPTGLSTAPNPAPHQPTAS